MGMQGNVGHHQIYFFYLLGMKFKNMRELKKFKSKNKYDDDENDDQSESSFSDILKYVRKDEKKTGKIKKKKTKKLPPTSSRVNDDNYQAPRSRSIDEINKMLVDMADNKHSGSVSSIPNLPSVDQKVLESSLYVSYNPGGRLNRRHGSMESVQSGTSSVSTGSAGSIMNPLRSSMKKPKKREASGSTISGSSSHSGKKSVRYAMGAEQTTV